MWNFFMSFIFAFREFSLNHEIAFDMVQIIQLQPAITNTYSYIQEFFKMTICDITKIFSPKKFSSCRMRQNF